MQGFPDFDPAAFLERTAAQVHSSKRSILVEDTAELPGESQALPISFQDSFLQDHIILLEEDDFSLQQHRATQDAEASQQQQEQQPQRQGATSADLMLHDNPHVTSGLVDRASVASVPPDALAEVKAWCRERGVNEAFAEAMVRAQVMSGGVASQSARACDGAVSGCWTWWPVEGLRESARWRSL